MSRDACMCVQLTGFLLSRLVHLVKLGFEGVPLVGGERTGSSHEGSDKDNLEHIGSSARVKKKLCE